ncbi:MAG TPA: hypothetical protein PKD53_12010, partial [Chloroflexaceae bacterium]|nr:hypothetical protein [Chloroflexaceae bacterium]
MAREGVARARAAIAQGRARDAVDLLAPFDPAALSAEVAREALGTRRAAIAALVAAHELGADALAAVEAALAALGPGEPPGR